MKHEEIERRIALLHALKAKYGDEPIPRAALDALLPPGPDVHPVVERWKTARGGIVGIEVCRTKSTIHFRARIKRPTDGKNLKGKRYASWQKAVQQRNLWAEKYYPGRPEYLCDVRAAAAAWGGKAMKK